MENTVFITLTRNGSDFVVIENKTHGLSLPKFSKEEYLAMAIKLANSDSDGWVDRVTTKSGQIEFRTKKVKEWKKVTGTSIVQYVSFARDHQNEPVIYTYLLGLNFWEKGYANRRTKLPGVEQNWAANLDRTKNPKSKERPYFGRLYYRELIIDENGNEQIVEKTKENNIANEAKRLFHHFKYITKYQKIKREQNEKGEVIEVIVETFTRTKHLTAFDTRETLPYYKNKLKLMSGGLLTRRNIEDFFSKFGYSWKLLKLDLKELDALMKGFIDAVMSEFNAEDVIALLATGILQDTEVASPLNHL